MDAAAIKDMRRVEDWHWWFQGRRSIVGDALRQLPLPRDAAILEAGCGTGGNLEMLSRFGRVHGFEPDEAARAMALERGMGQLADGFLPEPIPFEGTPFDLIVATDVLEHVEHHVEAVAALSERLKPGGFFVATVPAGPGLWSQHDVFHHHFRRYTRSSLRALFASAPLEIVRCSYYNTILYPVVVAVRKLVGASHRNGQEAPDTEKPVGPFNGLLRGIFSSERFWLRHGSLPIGVSLLIVARRK